MDQVHGTCVELYGIGVLLRGPSGCGKSDLALRLIDRGARLVADDRTDLALVDGRVVASAPKEIAGMIEVRGLGVVRLAAGVAPLGLVVDLVSAERIERMPEPRRERILGVPVAVLDLAPFEAGAEAKLRLAARLVCRRIMPAP